MYLAQCPYCGKIYKCHLINGKYITDYGDNISEQCIICKREMTPKIMKTQDWIADLVFIVKGK